MVTYTGFNTPDISYKNNWEAHEYYADGRRLKSIKRVVVGKELKSFVLDVNSFKDEVSYNDMGHTYTATSTQFTVTLRDEMFLIPHEFALSQLLRLGFYVKLVEGEFK